MVHDRKVSRLNSGPGIGAPSHVAGKQHQLAARQRIKSWVVGRARLGVAALDPGYA